jgi:hypothetical protein
MPVNKDEEEEKEAFRIMKERSALMDEDELLEFFEKGEEDG